MIWLDVTEESGNGIYFDIRGIETRRHGGETVFAIGGVLGDGQAESEILVEVGQGVEIVFVDEWLGRDRVHDLFARVGREELVSALSESAAGMSFCLECFPTLEGRSRERVSGYRSDRRWLPVRSHSYDEQMELPLGVSEAAA